MKKILIAAALLFSTSGVFAQESMKQEAGDVVLELGLNGFLGGGLGFTNLPISSLTTATNFVKARYFLSEDLAARAGVWLGYNSTFTPTTAAASPSGFATEVSSSSTVISIRPGIEKHLEGTDRLSPYFGADLEATFASSSAETIARNADGTVNSSIETSGTNGYTRFGINALTGVDYYFAKNLFIGLEAGFGIAYTGLSDQSVTTTTGGVVTTTETPQGSGFSLTPIAQGAFRIGYIFK